MSESEREARGYFTEVYTWRLLPEVPPFTGADLGGGCRGYAPPPPPLR